jgi:hypothetical protein
MTKITFFRRDGVFYGFEEVGHTGYGESGEDILCAALSSMTMLVVNTIEISFAGDVDYQIDDGAAKIRVESKCALAEFEADEKKRYAISGVFQGYFYELNDLVEEYYEFLEVDVKDE